MPFTPDDAEKHRKGLSKKGQKQWARIAESVRKRMMDKGMTEKEAAAEAVKQANGVMMNVNSGSYSVYKNKQKMDYEPKLVVHQDKPHIVVPVVMLVEGVHNGSDGPIYHSESDIGKNVESWNGIPVIIYHAYDEEGHPVSANSPEVIDNVSVGKVYNTVYEDGKLKAEVWFDEDRLNTVSAETLIEVNDSKEIEVSTGMFCDYEEKEGEWNGEKYNFVAHNYRPDHLAILPDEIGACSCKDGCGLGANSKNKNMDIKKVMATIGVAGYSVHRISGYAEQGYQALINEMYSELRKMDKSYDTGGVHHYEYNYLEELYSDYVIFTKSGDSIESKLYKQSYTVTDGEVALTGTPVEVHKKVDYVNANKDIQSSSKEDAGVEVNGKLINLNKEVNIMADNKCPKCLEKVNALIANKESKFEETDREWLLTQDEKTLDKLAPVVKEVEKIVEKTVEINKLSTEDQADLAWAKRMRKEKRDATIKGIQANTEAGTWDDATLNTMSEDVLDKLFKSVKKEETQVVDYSLNANVQSNTGGIEPMLPAGVTFEVRK
jgi:hypothetical protein